MKKGKTPPAPQKKQTEFTLDKLFLLLCLASGAFFRIYDLNRGLWPDEVHNWQNFSSKSISWILTHFLPAFNHIFHSVLVRFSTQLFNSQNEAVIRTPAALFGILQIWATYKLADLIYKNKQIALLSAGIIALSPTHIYFSQAARGYTLLMFFTTLSLCFLLSSEPDTKTRLGFVICGVLAAYSILTGVLFFIASFIWYLSCFIFEKKNEKPSDSRPLFTSTGLALFGLTFLLIALVYSPVLKEILTFKGQGTLKTFDFMALFNVPMTELYFYCIEGIGHTIAVFFLIGLAATFKTNKKIAGLFICILLIPFLLSFLTKTAPFARTFLFFMPIFYITATYGAWNLIERITNKINIKAHYGTTVTALLLVSVFGRYLAISYYSEKKDSSYKKSSHYLKEILKTSNYQDIIITEWNHDYSNSYYMGKELGRSLYRVYSSGKLNNLYFVHDGTSTIFARSLPMSLDRIRYLAVFGEEYRLDWALPEDKLELIKTFPSTNIYQVTSAQLISLPSQKNSLDFGSKLHWQRLQNAADFQIKLDKINFLRGGNSLTVASEQQSGFNILISRERFNVNIPADSIIIFLYAQPAADRSLATPYYMDASGKVNPVRMVYVNEINKINHLVKKGNVYWRINAYFYITKKEINNLGLFLMYTTQAWYDDFEIFVLK